MKQNTVIHSTWCAAFALACAVNVRGDGGGASKPIANPPATVENRVTEGDLTTITLTAEAVNRLAIKTAVAQKGSLARTRFFGGELIVPPGKSVQLTAPFTGTIVAAEGKPTPMPGSILKAGDVILRLQPVVMGDREVLTPSERISLARAAGDFEAAKAQAEGDVGAARVQLEASQVRLDRAKKLHQEKATSGKLLDEANAEFELSQARFEAAKAKASAWKTASEGMQAENAIVLNLMAPFDGILADLSVTPGEVVGVNTLVARIVAIDTLWVRVPIYVGEINGLLLDSEVRIGGLDNRPAPGMTVVERIGGTPTGDALSASIDVFFKLANPKGGYRPQQRVGVWIPTRESRAGLIVPWSAVLHDIHGGTWVYEQIKPQQFARRRVEVMAVSGANAQLSRGLKPGMNIVTDGCAELFGVEFGAGK